MPEEEKENIQKIIAEGIANAMKPVYYMISGIMFTVLAIFVSIALPLSQNVSANREATVLKINSDEAYANFLTKSQYHILQKSEHGVDIQAVKHPEQSDYLYMELNVNEAEQLEIRYRGSK